MTTTFVIGAEFNWPTSSIHVERGGGGRRKENDFHTRTEHKKKMKSFLLISCITSRKRPKQVIYIFDCRQGGVPATKEIHVSAHDGFRSFLLFFFCGISKRDAVKLIGNSNFKKNKRNKKTYFLLKYFLLFY